MVNKVPCAELRGISKQYPGSVKIANNNISLDLREGEILCIAGENGAGKTTLMKILCGLEKPSAGEIYVNGKKVRLKSALDAKKLKIGMVHQHFMLFPEYTAAENIAVGAEPKKWGVFFDTKTANRISDKIISENNFQIKSELKVKDLTLGQMQQVEICRILSHDAQIIIMDEPTSILTEQETDALFKTLKKLTGQGKSIILITHKINEIKKISNRVAILRKGELAGVFDTESINEYEIAKIMTDAEVKSEKLKVKSAGEKKEIITFNNVTVIKRGQKKPLLDKVSFFVSRAEILGITGVGGNGLGVIEAVLGGFLHPAEGKVLYKGKDVSALNIRALRKLGLSYVPADRLRVASAAGAAVEENMIINKRDDFFKRVLIDRKKVKEFTDKLIKDYNIEGAEAGIKCSVLSGGNLQKLILAREIAQFKDYIVFSEPTWGLDIASSAYVWEQINSFRDKGAAVVLISTNLEEILSLSDRIIVMYSGKAAGVFENDGEAIKESICNCMQGIG